MLKQFQFIVLYLIIGFIPDVNAEPPISHQRIYELNSYVDRTPESATQNLNNLGSYLIKASSNPIERSWVIYRWLITNISYKTEVLENLENYRAPGPHLLETRRAVCDGYSWLFLQLAARSNLNVKTITGWAKGYSAASSNQLSQQNSHAWNAVKIDGTWKLIDATWGAGYINQQGHFEHQPNAYYFFTEPEQFIIDHFPKDPDWQLLDNPVTKDEYLNLAKLEPLFFQYGLGLISHTRSTAQLNADEPIRLHVPENIVINAQATHNGTDLPDTKTLINYKELQEAEIKVRSEKKSFTLVIFARDRSQETRTMTNVLSYDVSFTPGAHSPYPQQLDSFTSLKAEIIEPLNGVLSKTSMKEFRFKIPDTEQAFLVYNSEWIEMKKDGSYFQAYLELRESGQIQLATSTASSNTYEILVRYRID